jgi:hypothetical protein
MPQKKRSSPFKNLARFKNPFQQQRATKELQTLPEPCTVNDLSSSFDVNRVESSDDNMTMPTAIDLSNVSLSESKPRSFEDEAHQHHRRMQLIKLKINTVRDLYNHYNTFHGSGTYNYLSLAHVFRNRTTSFGTNSSPDLNQNDFLAKYKKSVPSKLFIFRLYFKSMYLD